MLAPKRHAHPERADIQLKRPNRNPRTGLAIPKIAAGARTASDAIQLSRHYCEVVRSFASQLREVIGASISPSAPRKEDVRTRTKPDPATVLRSQIQGWHRLKQPQISASSSAAGVPGLLASITTPRLHCSRKSSMTPAVVLWNLCRAAAIAARKGSPALNIA